MNILPKQESQFAVCEVGMGGRLDATNILLPEVAVITQIDFDHENYLGHSIEEIAWEKAGIIKPGARVVSAAEHLIARVVIRQPRRATGRVPGRDRERVPPRRRSHRATAASRSLQSQPIPDARIPVVLPLPGRFQIRNALTAIAAARMLAERGAPIDDDAIARGIAATSWPGRLERIATAPDIYRGRRAQSGRRARNRSFLGGISSRAKNHPDLWSNAR